MQGIELQRNTTVHVKEIFLMML